MTTSIFRLVLLLKKK